MPVDEIEGPEEGHALSRYFAATPTATTGVHMAFEKSRDATGEAWGLLFAAGSAQFARLVARWLRRCELAANGVMSEEDAFSDKGEALVEEWEHLMQTFHGAPEGELQ